MAPRLGTPGACSAHEFADCAGGLYIACVVVRICWRTSISPAKASRLALTDSSPSKSSGHSNPASGANLQPQAIRAREITLDMHKHIDPLARRDEFLHLRQGRSAKALR